MDPSSYCFPTENHLIKNKDPNDVKWELLLMKIVRKKMILNLHELKFIKHLTLLDTFEHFNCIASFEVSNNI